MRRKFKWIKKSVVRAGGRFILEPVLDPYEHGRDVRIL